MNIRKKPRQVGSREEVAKRKDLYEQKNAEHEREEETRRKQAESERLKRKAIYEDLASRARAVGFKEENISHIIPWTVDNIRFGKRSEHLRSNWIESLPLLKQLYDDYGGYISDGAIENAAWGYVWEYEDERDYKNNNWKADLRYELAEKEISVMLDEEGLDLDPVDFFPYGEEQLDIEAIKVKIHVLGSQRRKWSGFPSDGEMFELYEKYGYDEDRWNICISRMRKLYRAPGLFLQDDLYGRTMILRDLAWESEYDGDEWEEHCRRLVTLFRDYGDNISKELLLKYSWESDLDAASWDTCKERMKMLFSEYKGVYLDEVLIGQAWNSGLEDDEWHDRFNTMKELFDEYSGKLSPEEIKKLAWECDIHGDRFRENIEKVVFCLKLHKNLLTEDEAHHIVFDAKDGIVRFPKHVIDDCKHRSLKNIMPLDGGVRCPRNGNYLSKGRRIIPDGDGEKVKIFFCDKCGLFYTIRCNDSATEISFGSDKVCCIKAPNKVSDTSAIIPSIGRVRELLNMVDVKIILSNENDFKCGKCGQDNELCSGDNAVVVRFIDGNCRKIKGSYCRDCKAITIFSRHINEFARYCSADFIKSVEVNIPEIPEKRIEEAISAFDSRSSILHVYRGRVKCQREGHSVISVRLSVPVTDRSNKPVINANYCYKCGKFFVSKSEYLHYLSKYPLVPLKFMSVNDDGETEYSFLKEESVLFTCGYTVDARIGLSDSSRQDILIEIIESGALSKSAVMDYLAQFINRNGRAKGMDIAKAKWERDLAFIRNYSFDKQIQASVDEIREG